MALQAAVAHNIWCSLRATDDPLFMKCTRCGQGDETLLHRRWACPNLNDSDHPAIKNTQHLVPRAVAGVADNAAFWLGCVLTGNMANQKVGLVPMPDCITQIEGNFVDILRLWCRRVRRQEQQFPQGPLRGSRLRHSHPPGPPRSQ